MARWGLVLPALASGAVLVVVGAIAGAPSAESPPRGRAVVVDSASCAGGGFDVVDVDAGGTVTRARLDGCGHAAGQTVDVVVPVGPDGVVQAASTVPDGSSATRLWVALLGLSGVAGGFLAHRLRPRPQATSSADAA
ncbi:hypothetical protein [Actinosynnema sp. NPDC020468]|uniref:hypothetical protein n=1 Tax=Actinosynnema sp. NPDC020468 TaxID=3154488 RepID=UPI0033DAD25A